MGGSVGSTLKCGTRHDDDDDDDELLSEMAVMVMNQSKGHWLRGTCASVRIAASSVSFDSVPRGL